MSDPNVLNCLRLAEKVSEVLDGFTYDQLVLMVDAAKSTGNARWLNEMIEDYIGHGVPSAA